MVRKEIIYVTKEDIQMPGLWVRDRSITCGSFGKCLRFPVTKKESFESLRLPLDKISCTRQFESKLSLRSFAKSLAKGSSTSNQAFLLRRKDVTALLGAQNRYALRLADHQRSSPCCAGWDRLGVSGDTTSTALDVFI